MNEIVEQTEMLMNEWDSKIDRTVEELMRYLINSSTLIVTHKIVNEFMTL